MIRIALKDLLGRKLRLVLTSLAIVMGVAMVSGTFVLTDTINAGFKTIFTTAFATSDAVVTGKEVFGGTQNAPSFPESTLAQGARPPRRRRGRGRRRRPGAVRRPEREGDLARRRTRPRVQRQPGRRRALQPADAHVRQVAARARPGGDGRAHRLGSAHHGRRQGRRGRPRRQGEAVHGQRHRAVRGLDLARRRDDRGLRPAHRPGALQQGGPARPDLRRREAGRVVVRARRARSSRCCRRTRRCGPASSRRRSRPTRPPRSSRSCATSCSRSAASRSSSARS